MHEIKLNDMRPGRYLEMDRLFQIIHEEHGHLGFAEGKSEEEAISDALFRWTAYPPSRDEIKAAEIAVQGKRIKIENARVEVCIGGLPQDDADWFGWKVVVTLDKGIEVTFPQGYLGAVKDGWERPAEAIVVDTYGKRNCYEIAEDYHLYVAAASPLVRPFLAKLRTADVTKLSA